MKVSKLFILSVLLPLLVVGCICFRHKQVEREKEAFLETSELHQEIQRISEKAKEDLKAAESLKERADNLDKDLESKLDQIDHDMFVLKYLIDEAYTYSEKPNKTEADKLILNALVEEINDMSAKLSGSSKVKLKITITVDGSIAEPREEIDKELEKLE